MGADCIGWLWERALGDPSFQHFLTQGLYFHPLFLDITDVRMHREKPERTAVLEHALTIQSTVPKTCPCKRCPSITLHFCANTSVIPCDPAGIVSCAKKCHGVSHRRAHCRIRGGLAAARPPRASSTWLPTLPPARGTGLGAHTRCARLPAGTAVCQHRH